MLVGRTDTHFLKELFIYFFGCTGSLLLHASFVSLQRVGATLVVVHRLLIAEASLVAERRLYARGLQ